MVSMYNTLIINFNSETLIVKNKLQNYKRNIKFLNYEGTLIDIKNIFK